MNQQQENTLITAASLFVKTLTEIQGAERGMELWDRIAEVIDPNIKGKIFFSMLSNNFGTLVLYVAADKVEEVKANKLAASRCLRNYADLSLQDSIFVLNDLLDGKCAKISVKPENTMTVINELRLYGIAL